MRNSLEYAIRVANEYKFIRIVPASNLDALIASSILSKNLEEHDIKAPINTDPKIILDNIDEPLLGVDLPINTKTGKEYRNLNILFSGDSSLSAHVVYYLDKIFGVTTWDKILAIIAGVYRGLDFGREGFRGLEKEILDELTGSKYIGIDLGLRLWGWKKHSLFKALYRTLIPFIPGYSGDPSRTYNVLKNILGINEPEKMYGEHILSFTEEGLENTRLFLEKLSNNMEQIDQETRNKILVKLLGYIYIITINNYILDLHEIIGSLLLFMCLSDENIYYILLTSIDDLIIYQSLIHYNSIIDEISAELATSIKRFLNIYKPIFEASEFIRRPEIYIEIIKSMEKIPQDKPVAIVKDGQNYTTVSELIRLGVKPEKVYSLCNEYQLCMVNENGNYIKT